MRLAVVAYPHLDPHDSEWIESFRAQYDSASSRIAAHFTLVFPTDLEAGVLGRHLATVAPSVESIDFDIEAVTVHTDDGISRVFLVPGHGAAEIASLHERLNAVARGPRDENAREFIPHITVGQHRRLGDAKHQASSMRARWRDVKGHLSRLELVAVEAGPVRPIAQYQLGQP